MCFQEPTIRIAAAGTLLPAMLTLGLAATVSAQIPGDANCDAEIATIDNGEDSTLEGNRFRHVFLRTREYPFYRKFENVFLGVHTVLRVADARRPGERLWTSRRGRENVGAEGHYSLIHDFRGKTTFRGISVDVTADKEFAFFLYDRNDDSNAGWYAHMASKGVFPVLTTTDGAPEFVEVGSLGLANSRFGSRRNVVRRGKSSSLDKELIRALFFVDISTTVAGQQHTATKFCLLDGATLALTNTDALVPAIEQELIRRARKIDAGRTAASTSATPDEKRAAFRRLESADTWVHVTTVPENIEGDFKAGSTVFGNVEITFTRDPLSDDIHYRATPSNWFDFFVNGRLSVGGKYIGQPVEALLGRYWRCCSTKTTALMEQQFRSVRWTNKNNIKVECDSGECEILVKKSHLRLQ